MTNEDALKLVKDCGFNINPPLHDEVLKTVENALEKQIAKKPTPDTKYYGNGKCPDCGVVFIDKETNYCGNCGQKLDWRDAK